MNLLTKYNVQTDDHSCFCYPFPLLIFLYITVSFLIDEILMKMFLNLYAVFFFSLEKIYFSNLE
jgi:hypothetical protein